MTIEVPTVVRRHDSAVAKMRDTRFELTGDLRRRALLLAEALVREARRRDLTVDVHVPRQDSRSTGRRTAQLVFASDGAGGVRLWFAEPRHRHETPGGRNGPDAAFPTYVYSESQRLVIRGAHTTSYTTDQEWRDTKTQALEVKLHLVLEWVDRRLTYEAERQARWEAEFPERERARLAEIERMRAQLAADKLERTLVDHASRWRRAQDIREYLAAVRNRLSADTDATKLAETEAWLAASTAIADRLDPLGPTL